MLENGCGDHPRVEVLVVVEDQKPVYAVRFGSSRDLDDACLRVGLFRVRRNGRSVDTEVLSSHAAPRYWWVVTVIARGSRRNGQVAVSRISVAPTVPSAGPRVDALRVLARKFMNTPSITAKSPDISFRHSDLGRRNFWR
ncbi:hypothetical protein NKH77_53555 [Streptomyces sp. M19]